MPPTGRKPHHCGVFGCEYKSSTAGGKGYCEKHQEPCPDQAKNHPNTHFYIYKKTVKGSFVKPCEACKKAVEGREAREKEEREEQEKKAKKAADKVALKQMPPKERTKARHDKDKDGDQNKAK